MTSTPTSAATSVRACATTEPPRYRQFLSESSAFSSLESRHLDSLLQIAEIVRAKAGETIFQRGDVGDRVLIILSGSVAVETPNTRGGSVVVNFLRPGEIFGEMAVVADAPRSATVTAAEACELLAIPQSEFLSLLVEHPGLGIQILGTVSDRLRHLTGVVAGSRPQSEA